MLQPAIHHQARFEVSKMSARPFISTANVLMRAGEFPAAAWNDGGAAVSQETHAGGSVRASSSRAS